MKMVRAGVIGLGNMGSAHAACLASHRIEGMELAAICDIEAAKREFYMAKYPNIPCFSDYTEMLDSGKVDAVIVAVPHRLHALIAEAAFKRDLHVLVEKPVDITVSAARRLNDLAEKSDRVFGIMLNQRTNPLFRKARDMVQSGQLGELKRSVWIVTNWYRSQAYYDSGDWRATWAGEGGGVLLNQAPHNLDLWQWICGMPQSLWASCSVAKYHHIEVEDDAVITARYPNGATGIFITSTGEYPGTNRLEISGDLGKLVLENGVLKWWKLKTSEQKVRYTAAESFPQIETEYTEIKQEEPETAHAGILQNFANAVLRGEPLLAPGTDGISELMISNAAYLSSWTGNREIALPIDGAEFDRELAKRQANSVFKENTHAVSESQNYQARWQVKW